MPHSGIEPFAAYSSIPCERILAAMAQNLLRGTRKSLQRGSRCVLSFAEFYTGQIALFGVTSPFHGCCWETFYMFAGLVVEIPT